MTERNKKDILQKEHIQKIIARGPGEDCQCSVCIFAKSHAPGQVYKLEDCPKCRPLLK